MTHHTFLEKAIEIDASPSQVWRIFTDPVLTRQMGGEYVSDWKAGSAFGWKGLDGTMYTRGTILAIEPEQLLQHNLFANADSGAEVVSVIAYTLVENNGRTTLYAREDFSTPLDQDAYTDVVAGWDAALGALKNLAEKL